MIPTQKQIDILRCVDINWVIPERELCKKAGVTYVHTHATVKRFVKLNLLKKYKNGSRFVVEITDKGKDFLKVLDTLSDYLTLEE